MTKVEDKKVSTCPSPHGSHSSMIVEEFIDKKIVEIDGIKRTIAEDEVVLKDDDGLYITKKNRLDTKMADGNRHGRKIVRNN